MKKRVWILCLICSLLLTLAACGQAETPAAEEPAVEETLEQPAEEPVEETVEAAAPEADYSREMSTWVYQPQTDDPVVERLMAIDGCRYGAAGASLDQLRAAVGLLELTEEDVTEGLKSYLDGMDGTQLDYFSFQWQMRVKQAKELLEQPDNREEELETAGLEAVELTAYDGAKLNGLDEKVMMALQERGVEDQWKNHGDLEPFSLMDGTSLQGKLVEPLPQTVDPADLGSCTVPVSFTEGDAYVDDTGAMQLKVTVYAYDLYDMVDMAMLEVGDRLLRAGETVEITELERTDSGAVVINGGLEKGGFELYTDESTVFFESGYNDVKNYYALGQAVIPVSADFVYTDASDLDAEPVEYYAGDFLTADSGIEYFFIPANTALVVEDGVAIALQRHYIP